MTIYVIDNAPDGATRIEADSFEAAEAKLAAMGGGDLVGELIEEGEWKSASATACGLTEIKFADAGEPMTFSGYGAVFNNVDLGGDKVMPGAFSESLASHKATGTLPAMFYQHGDKGGGPVMPVGKWTSMVEDAHGLRVEGKLFDHSLGRDLHVALKGGGIGGLSIGYRVKMLEPRVPNSEARRHIKSADLIEVSLVNQPMNPMARLLSVKSADQITTIRDLEHGLRDAGYSKADAVRICARFQAKAAQGEPDRDEAIAMALRRNLSILSQ